MPTPRLTARTSIRLSLARCTRIFGDVQVATDDHQVWFPIQVKNAGAARRLAGADLPRSGSGSGRNDRPLDLVQRHRAARPTLRPRLRGPHRVSPPWSTGREDSPFIDVTDGLDGYLTVSARRAGQLSRVRRMTNKAALSLATCA